MGDCATAAGRLGDEGQQTFCHNIVFALPRFRAPRSYCCCLSAYDLLQRKCMCLTRDWREGRGSVARARAAAAVAGTCQFQGIWLQQNANLSISSKWSTGVWGFRPLVLRPSSFVLRPRSSPESEHRLLLTFAKQTKYRRTPVSLLVCISFLQILGCMAKFSAAPRQITCSYTGQIVCCVFCRTRFWGSQECRIAGGSKAINYAGKFFPDEQGLCMCNICILLGFYLG